jgi:MFS family permease
MLLTASGGMTVALAVLVIGVHAGNLPPMALLASILLYVGFFAFGMGPVPWVVISEIFPNKIRGRAASVATSALWTGALLVAFTFLSLLRALGVAGTFALFAILSAFSFGFVLKCVPETRGKSLEQIQDQWKD